MLDSSANCQLTKFLQASATGVTYDTAIEITSGAMQMRFGKLRSVLIIFILAAVSWQSQLVQAAPTLTLVWQTKFAGDAVVALPGDIAVDAAGNSFVSTQSANGVKKFDDQGNFVTQWGGGGKGEGKFSLTLGVAVDTANNVYVADFYNKRIQKFDNDGTFLLEWANEPSTSPAFIAIDADNNVYVDEFPPHDGHYIQKFDSSGKLLSEWGNTDNRFGGRIEDIALDKHGNLYVADALGHRVQKLDADGNLLATFGGKASKEGNGLFDEPFGIAIDSADNIYVLDANFLQKLDADGNFVTQWSTSGGDLDAALNISIDAQDNIYVFAKAEVPTVDGKTIRAYVLKKFSPPQ
jgi:sugar lactone lactonase YvrE